ncbi:MAG: DNA primase, partial [Muribaculaceae bacterium]|nr:DNA primase [Muribaculaceae bacterium]
MHRLDPITVQKILDTADIVDVVSDFVSLKPRGTGYIGLCPFHNDRRPSFSVSKTRNVCKCFSCGQGGGPVNFIMLHEQMTYQEALRYLAKKYNIEIKEREMTDEERAQEGERQSMLAINDYALSTFHSTLLETDEGRNVGLAYFRERGISDAMIDRFRLGYSLENRDAFCRGAIAKGFSREYLVKTGLAYDSEHGLRDRFRGRVIYPVFSMSGKVVAFGGRTLRKDKDIAKYVNSPESLIYSKKRELYGLYQAKRAIAARDKCIMVEGYMDVISMHQRGVENVVASSGTALTEEQIRLVHRFTDNVMLVYDSDAAGIKASLRGIGMLLSEGMNISVLHLPDGEDPDSFAQSHSSTEVEAYIKENETDFIRFMTRILLKDAQDDPIRRAKVISRIVATIALIPDEITRTVYIGECSRMLDIDEKVLTLQVARDRADKLHRDAEAQTRRRNASAIPAETTPPPADTQEAPDMPSQQQQTPARAPENEAEREERKFLLPAEME